MRRVRKSRRRAKGGTNCAPGFGKEGSCLPPEVVGSMEAKVLGGRSPKAVSLKRRVSQLMRAKGCASEACLVDRKTRERFYRPEKQESWRKNPREWLDSNDILKVMKQYETYYDFFEFLGPSPSDFDAPDGPSCVWEELCKFDLQKWLRRGKTMFGVIFNIDPHTSSGSHWVSVFVNADTGNVYYFDSTGDAITPRIRRFVEKVRAQSARLFGEPFEFDSSEGVEHQLGDTECGIYALYFMQTMIRESGDPKAFGRIFKEARKVIRDKEMEKFRNVFFNEPVA